MRKILITLGFIATMAAGADNRNELANYNYVIADGYTKDGKTLKHHVSTYTRNVDGSITFLTEQGSVTTIPYPYFTVSTPSGDFISNY